MEDVTAAGRAHHKPGVSQGSRRLTRLVFSAGPGPGAALTLPAGPSRDHIRSWTGLGQGCWGGGIGSGLPLPLSDMKPPIYLKACGGRQAVTCERPGFPAFPGRLSSVLLLIKW